MSAAARLRLSLILAAWLLVGFVVRQMGWAGGVLSAVGGDDLWLALIPGLCLAWVHGDLCLKRWAAAVGGSRRRRLRAVDYRV